MRREKLFLYLFPHKEKNTIYCENSSVGRAQPCQGWGREFESRFSLNEKHPSSGVLFSLSSAVENALFGVDLNQFAFHRIVVRKGDFIDGEVITFELFAV